MVAVGLPLPSLPFFYFFFLYFWLYLGCFCDWVEFGMWKSLTIRLGFEIWGIWVAVLYIWKSKVHNQVENVSKGKKEKITFFLYKKKGVFGSCCKMSDFLCSMSPWHFFLEVSNLWRLVLIITLYYQIKTLVSFLYRQEDWTLNLLFKH